MVTAEYCRYDVNPLGKWVGDRFIRSLEVHKCSLLGAKELVSLVRQP